MDKTKLKLFVRQTMLTAIGFLALSLLVTTVIYSVLGDRPLADVESGLLTEKERIVRADSSINTIFVGSSITFRQINPEVFDTSASDSNKYYSYNLGNPGLYPMRSISYLEHLIDNPPPNVKYIVSELFRLDTVAVNYKSPEIMRITGFGPFIDDLQTIGTANFPLDYKLYLATQYLRALAFKAFGFGMKTYLQYHRTPRARDLERIEKSLRGFYPKDTEIQLTSEAEMVQKLVNVRLELEERPQLLEQRRTLHIDKYARQWLPQDNPFVEKLVSLIRKADAKGIKLVYFLPPLQTVRGLHFAYPIYQALPVESRIDLSDPRKFPELYQTENVFDLEHVNNNGAVFLSRYLADEFASLQDKQK